MPYPKCTHLKKSFNIFYKALTSDIGRSRRANVCHNFEAHSWFTINIRSLYDNTLTMCFHFIKISCLSDYRLFRLSISNKGLFLKKPLKTLISHYSKAWHIFSSEPHTKKTFDFIISIVCLSKWTIQKCEHWNLKDVVKEPYIFGKLSALLYANRIWTFHGTQNTKKGIAMFHSIELFGSIEWNDDYCRVLLYTHPLNILNYTIAWILIILRTPLWQPSVIPHVLFWPWI